MSLPEKLRGRSSALTVSELAELLNVSSKAIYRLIERKQVPFFKISNSIRFDPPQLADWLQEKYTD